MTVPGSNLLNQALRVIQRQTFQYIAFQARNTNSAGQDVALYANPVTVTGSVQPVPRSVFQQLGLNFQRNYRYFYLPDNVFDIDRDISGDQMCFQGATYQCISKTDWFGVDGWLSVLCVEVITPG